MKVLVADDEPNIRLLVSAIIESDEYEVLEAVDGDMAWELIVTHRPPLVILDVQMPGRDGLSIVRAIRADPSLASLRIIMLSGKAQESNVEAGRQAGADLYLTKPFMPHDLLQAVDHVMKGA